MATKTTRQGQLFPGAHDVPLRQALSGALPGLLHHLDHWFAMRYFPLQKEDSLHPEQSYTALDQLYQQAIREVRSALTSWRNPWIPAPRCICVAMQNDILYHEVRHEVWIHKKEQYFLQLVDLYTLGLANLLTLSETARGKAGAWRGQMQTLLADVERLKARYRDVAFDHLQGLDQELSRFEQALQEAFLRWQDDPVLGGRRNIHETFSQLRAVLWERMHQLLIHELLHAWTRRKRRFGGRRWGWYRQKGVERFDPAHAQAHAHRPGRLFQHWAMNEAIADWIMLRISEGPTLLHWQGVIMPLGYSYWLVNDIAAALDALWERVSAAVPALPRKRIHTAQDLFYAIYFRDPAVSTLLEQGLAVVTGDLQAFALLSQACERFTLGSGAQTTAEEAHLRQSLADVQRLLGSVLPPAERQVPFPFWLMLSSPGVTEQLVRAKDAAREASPGALPY